MAHKFDNEMQVDEGIDRPRFNEDSFHLISPY